MATDPFDLKFGSEEMNVLLEILDKTAIQPNASNKVDIMSGAYKFSDEIPKMDEDSNLLFPLVTLLRNLWAFRISLVRENPRMELAHWWDMTKKNAPNWAGFAEERCSVAAMPYVHECEIRCQNFDKEAKAFEQYLENQ